VSAWVATGPLQEDEFLELVVPQLRSVFTSLDPWQENPFVPDVESWVLLPVPLTYVLSEAELSVVASAAYMLGDDGFFEVMVEGEYVRSRFEGWASQAGYDSGYGNPARYFAWQELDAYRMRLERDPDFAFPFLETAIVGATRPWGILVSHEDHALAGGPSAFVARLLDLLPPYDPGEWSLPPPVFDLQRPPTVT